MSHDRFTAQCERSQGLLLLGEQGIEFAPEFAADGAQLGMAWDGWQLPWEQIVDVERVLPRRGARVGSDDQAVRLHHSGGARFTTIILGAELDGFLTAFDARMVQRRGSDGRAA